MKTYLNNQGTKMVQCLLSGNATQIFLRYFILALTFYIESHLSVFLFDYSIETIYEPESQTLYFITEKKIK